MAVAVTVAACGWHCTRDTPDPVQPALVTVFGIIRTPADVGLLSARSSAAIILAACVEEVDLCCIAVVAEEVVVLLPRVIWSVLQRGDILAKVSDVSRIVFPVCEVKKIISTGLVLVAEVVLTVLVT